MFTMNQWITYICCASIVALVTHVPRQTKISNFHHLIVADQNIAGSKVSVHNLPKARVKHTERVKCHSNCIANTSITCVKMYHRD